MPGRALVADDGAVITAPMPRSASAEAAWWREQALGEHASVASFSRAVFELSCAAQQLAHRAAATDDAHVRGVLTRQAADEARHAELAWDIIAWCDDGPVTLRR